MAVFGMPGGTEWWIILFTCFGPVLLIGLIIFAVSRASGPRAGLPPAAAPAGWLADPRGRHELRYWNGASWTSSVSDNGVQSVDPRL